MDAMFTSNGNARVYILPVSGIADYRSPTAAELAAALDVSDAIAWDGTTFPSATDSEDIEDRSLLSKGNATSRGAASFEATLNFFYPKQNIDTVSDFGKAYNMLRVPRVPVYVVTMVAQAPEGDANVKPVAGDWVSVYRFISDGWTDDIEGDDSFKYAISFLTQGELAVYTQVKNATPVVVTNASGSTSLAVGGHAVLRATLGGKRATQAVNWVSSDLSKATVSQNGVVTAVGAGSVDITASHPAASAASTKISFTIA